MGMFASAATDPIHANAPISLHFVFASTLRQYSAVGSVKHLFEHDYIIFFDPELLILQDALDTHDTQCFFLYLNMRNYFSLKVFLKTSIVIHWLSFLCISSKTTSLYLSQSQTLSVCSFSQTEHYSKHIFIQSDSWNRFCFVFLDSLLLCLHFDVSGFLVLKEVEVAFCSFQYKRRFVWRQMSINCFYSCFVRQMC